MNTTAKSKIRSTPNEGSAASIRYGDDLFGWAHQQIALLRHGRLTDIDTDNIAEELSDAAGEQYDELESALRIVLLHQLEWDHQPAHRSRSWVRTSREQRKRIDRVLRKNPSLTPHCGEAINEGYDDARADAAIETGLLEAISPASCPYDWTVIMTRAVEFGHMRSPNQ